MWLTSVNTNGRRDNGLFKALCATTDIVGDAVRLRGDRLGNLFQVTKLNIDDSDTVKFNMAGIITKKYNTETCLIRWQGILDGIYTGLTYGLPVFVGVDGRLTLTRPANPISGQRALIIPGTVLSQSTILINIQKPTILRPT